MKRVRDIERKGSGWKFEGEASHRDLTIEAEMVKESGR